MMPAVVVLVVVVVDAVCLIPSETPPENLFSEAADKADED